MKWLLLIAWFPITVAAQNTVEINTVKFRYEVGDQVEFESDVPQLANKLHESAQTRINKDLRKYFIATAAGVDSIHFSEKLFREYKASAINGFEAEEAEEQTDERFDIDYLSEDLLSIGISHTVSPRGGRQQFFFESANYDLHSGYKLEFDEFFNIGKEALKMLVREKGYYVEFGDDVQSLKIDPADEYIPKHIESLYSKTAEIQCTAFYFKEINHELQLIFVLECAGPMHLYCGIAVADLAPYLIYPYLRTDFRAWGTDIQSLRGFNYHFLGKEVPFDDYTIVAGGGYVIPKGNNAGDYAVEYWNSPKHWYYLLVKMADGKRTIMDILEIKKFDLTDYKLIDTHCETGQHDTDAEIIAIVKDHHDNPEYYTAIEKAWRANRKTGKFEKVGPKKIKRCGNESFGD